MSHLEPNSRSFLQNLQMPKHWRHVMWHQSSNRAAFEPEEGCKLKPYLQAFAATHAQLALQLNAPQNELDDPHPIQGIPLNTHTPKSDLDTLLVFQ